MNEHISKLIPEIKQLCAIAKLLANNGWAEANAGNISIRLERELHHLTESGEQFPLPAKYSELAEKFFLVTATKSRMRDIPNKPADCLGIIKISADGSSYVKLWGKTPVTSEFPSHLAIHSMCKKKRPTIKAILHTHPPYLLVLSHFPEMRKNEALNDVLKRMHPEIPILMPSGMKLLPYRLPGTVKLANETVKALRKVSLVVWCMHGVVSIAPDIEQAYDQVELYEKVAQIYLMGIWAGKRISGLSNESLKEAWQVYGKKWEY